MCTGRSFFGKEMLRNLRVIMSFDENAQERDDTRLKIKETLLILELKLTLHDNVSSEKLYPY